MQIFSCLRLFVHRKLSSLSHRSRVSFHSVLLKRVFVSESRRAAHGAGAEGEPAARRGCRSPSAVGSSRVPESAFL